MAHTLSKLPHLSQLSNATLLSLDINPPVYTAAAVETAVGKTSGSLEYLVNNSGVGYFAHLLDSDIEKGKEIGIRRHLLGALRVTQAFSALLIAAQELSLIEARFQAYFTSLDRLVA